MKVLHVYRTYFPDPQGGLQEVIRQICHNGNHEGIESRVFTLSNDTSTAVIKRPECTVIRGQQLTEIASCNIGYPSALQDFKKQVAWADIIHYHFPWPYADLLHLLSSIKKPTVLTYHSDIVRQQSMLKIYSPLMHRFLRSIDHIVATSPNYLASSEVLCQYKDKTRVIPIGLDEQSFPLARDKHFAKMLAHYGKNFFLFIGVLRYYKGLDILIKAMKDAPYRVVIAGTGPIEKELRDLAQHHQLSNVVFAGFVSEEEKVALLQLSQAVVFPSPVRSEAFGVTLLEGAMFSKPLICCEIGSGTSYVNMHEETGLVIPPYDATALRKAMDTIDQSPGNSKQMGNNARKRFDTLFTGKIMGEQYAALYQSILSNRAAA